MNRPKSGRLSKRPYRGNPAGRSFRTVSKPFASRSLYQKWLTLYIFWPRRLFLFARCRILRQKEYSVREWPGRGPQMKGL